MAGMLFLLIHVHPEHFPLVQKVIKDDLATYKDETIPYWETISDSVWATCSESRSLHMIVGEIFKRSWRDIKILS